MPTLACRIELNKQNGITVTVENKEGKITQTVVLDGTSITIQCAGDQDTSSITQKCDSITVKCRNFTVDAETITCKSTKDTLHTSSQKYTVKSDQAMELKSGAGLTCQAAAEAMIKGQSLTGSADNAAKISGTSVSLSGTQKVEASGAQLSLSGTTKAEMSGMAVDISAQGKMDVSGQLTTLKGSMTNVQGSIIKLG